MAGPSNRMADRAKNVSRISKAGLDGDSERRELQGCGQIHA
jgi:hypothetical protein